MIPCPACKGHNVRGRRGPKLVGKAVFRRHFCGDCGRKFASFQVAIDSDSLVDWAEELARVA